MDRDIEGVGVAVRHLSISRSISPATNLTGLVQLWRLLRRDKFDVLCMECSIAGFMGRVAGALLRVPVRIFVIQLYASHPWQSWLKRTTYRLIEKALAPLTTHYVAVSANTRQFGVERGIIDPRKTRIIFNSVEIPDELPQTADALLAEFRVPPGSIVIGTLARLDRQKALQDMLHATALVCEQHENVVLLIAGEGPLCDELTSLAATLGIDHCVRFLGWRTDVQEVLRCFDIYCLSSLWEALPFALVEAMAMARPIVATSVDGVPEIIVDGDNGFLAPPRRPDLLARGLLALTEDAPLRARMGKRGRERARSMFSVDTMVPQYAALFREAAAPAIEKNALDP